MSNHPTQHEHKVHKKAAAHHRKAAHHFEMASKHQLMAAKADEIDERIIREREEAAAAKLEQKKLKF
jgi:hypothetical protein